MREIKFRGIDKNGHVVYGSLIRDYRLINTEAESVIRIGNSNTHVDSKSVGQFTGLKDKNGVEIYEGDILKTETDKNMVVGWSSKHASFVLEREGWLFKHYFGEAADPEYVEVIGNIYQNAELLQAIA